VSTKGFRSGHHPKVFTMCGDQQLAGTSIRKFISLQLASNVHGIFGTKINRVGIAIAVGTLNDDSLIISNVSETR
jgi:hypothetical protein